MSHSVANDILPTSLSKCEKHPRIQDFVSSLADFTVLIRKLTRVSLLVQATASKR
jgi:hypothetical protein